MFDYYARAAERTNDVPDDNGEPLDMTIIRLRDIIESQAREITRLQEVIHQLEQAPVGYVFEQREREHPR